METKAKIEQATRTARNKAIDRIKQIMLPGAHALATTRLSTSPDWITVEREIGDATLRWVATKCSGCWGSIIETEMSPEALADLAHVAKIETNRIVRECAQQVAAYAAEQAILRAAYEAVAADAA